MLPVYLKNEGCHGSGWRDQQREKEDFFQTVREREIIDEDQESDWAQNTVLRHSSFDKERRLKDSVESHMLAKRVDEVS